MGDEGFRNSKFTHTPNPRDSESTTNEGEDEEFLLNRNSEFPPSPNPKDYETTIDEGEDEEFTANVKNEKNQIFKKKMKP